MQSTEKLKAKLINSMSRRLRKLVLFSNKPLKTTNFANLHLDFLRNPFKLIIIYCFSFKMTISCNLFQKIKNPAFIRLSYQRVVSSNRYSKIVIIIPYITSGFQSKGRIFRGGNRHIYMKFTIC